MGEVASAFVSLIPSARGFGSKLDSEIGGEVNKSGSKSGKLFGTALKVGAIAAVGGAALAAGFLKGSLDEAREAQKVAAQTNAVIKSTGGVAGVTAKQVGSLATAISNKTGIDDEQIQSSENMLLTFTNVRNEVGKGNDIFNRATQTVTDMSVALGQDSKNSAIQLGKALNDPIKGITALSRVGVAFTDQQKEQIKTMVESGNRLGAQKIILGELNREFGGSAAAAATAGDKFKVAFGNLEESVGTALLPLVDKVLGGLTVLATVVAGKVGPAIASLSRFLAPAAATVQKFFASLSGGGSGAGAIGATVAAIGASFQGLLPTLGALATGFGQTFATIAGFIQSLLPTVLSVVTKIASVVGPGLATIGNLIAGQVLPAFRAFLPVLLPVAKVLLTMFGAVVVGLIGGFVQAVVGAINIVAGVLKLITAIIHGDWSAAWAALVQIVTGALNLVIGVVRVYLFSTLLGLFRAAIVPIVAVFISLGPRILGVLSAAWGAITGVVSAGMNAVKAHVTAGWNAVKAVVTTAVNATRAVVTAVFAAIVSAVRAYVNAYRAAVTAAFNAARAVVTAAVNATRAVVTAAFNAIRAVVSASVNAIRAVISAGFNAAKAIVTSVLAAMRAAVSSGLAAMRAAFSSGMAAIKSVVSEGFDRLVSAAKAGISSVVGTLSGLAGKAKAAVGNLGSALYSAGASLVQGLINGIQAKIGSLLATLHHLTSLIPAHKGPIQKDRSLLRPAGKAIMSGLVAGIDDGQSDLISILRGVTSTIAVRAPKVHSSIATGVAAASTSTNGLTVAFNGNVYATDPNDLARKLDRRNRAAATLALSR